MHFVYRFAFIVYNFVRHVNLNFHFTYNTQNFVFFQKFKQRHILYNIFMNMN